MYQALTHPYILLSLQSNKYHKQQELDVRLEPRPNPLGSYRDLAGEQNEGLILTKS